MVVESIVVQTAAKITLVLLALAVLLAFIRLLAGPSQADRIVALDLISVLIVAILAALSIYRQQRSFLDVAIAYALISFLGTVALARFRERLARSGRIDEYQEEIDK
ncbi:MAG: monovalent cation/H+ antiporter complex subunit F [Desulfosalsimonas sp.]|uniref:monovalent cation/H+ antiporter complex subunit F n=1 Tax=Desulfosalsimonas sp. TaxID=3073848 RepID=UPI003970EC56